MSQNLFGSRVPRIEDRALLVGEAQFVDDLEFPNLLEAAFVRSPLPHALIRSIDASVARDLPGVHAVYSSEDLTPHLRRERMPVMFSTKGCRSDDITPFVLARDEVCFAGEAVAVVIAENRYIAEDAASLVEVDYEPLAAVADCKQALAPDSPIVHRDCDTNVIAEFSQSYGDCDSAFAEAKHVVSISLKQHRGCAHSIEGRGLVSVPDRASHCTTVWTSTQMAHEVRGHLMTMLGCDENELRVVTPEVGGGFGAKNLTYPEEVAVVVVSRILGRPVKWIEDRREHFLAAVQERDQYWDIEMAVDADAKILGVRGRIIHDQGAYTATGVNVAYNSSTSVPGPYVVPSYHMDVVLTETNKVPGMTLRGAGYPQAAFAMERLIDRAARELGMDRAEVRRRNLIPAEAMPYTTPLMTRAGTAVSYESGDYPKCQARALEAIDYASFADRQTAARADGRYIGLGVGSAVKGSGRGPFESGIVRIGRSGRVSVYTGAMPMGQGTKTMLAQLCADQLGVPVEDVRVIAGDTATVQYGLGGYASRQAVTAGSSVHLAAVAVREKAKRVASHLLECAADDLELIDAQVRVKGTDRSVSLAETARMVAGLPGYGMPDGVEVGMEASRYHRIDALAYSNATHAVEVEVDIGTGAVTILRYVVVNDSGRMINPMIVDGQIHGGVAHGIGNALYERMVYGDDAQPLTTNFGEYLLPTSTEVPALEVIYYETPSTLNPLGIKGVGESGTIPAAPAIISAVENALSPFDVWIDETPIFPDRIVELIRGSV